MNKITRIRKFAICVAANSNAMIIIACTTNGTGEAKVVGSSPIVDMELATKYVKNFHSGQKTPTMGMMIIGRSKPIKAGRINGVMIAPIVGNIDRFGAGVLVKIAKAKDVLEGEWKATINYNTPGDGGHMQIIVRALTDVELKTKIRLMKAELKSKGMLAGKAVITKPAERPQNPPKTISNEEAIRGLLTN